MNIPTGSLYRESEPHYQENGARIKFGSAGDDNMWNMFHKTDSEKLCDQQFNCNEREKYLKTCDKLKMIANPVNPKPNIVYGVITAKEVAKYRPCTQDIIIRQ